MGASLIEVSEKGRFCVCVILAYLGGDDFFFSTSLLRVLKSTAVNSGIDSFPQIKSNGVSQKVVLSLLTGLYPPRGRSVLALGC